MKKSVIILAHVLFWAFVIIRVVAQPHEMSVWTATAKYAQLLEYGFPLYFYVSYFFLAKVFRKKKTALYFLGSLLGIGILLFFAYKTGFNYYIITILRISRWCLYGLFLRFFIDYLQKEREQTMLVKQNLQSELSLLRTQINPHFLFNSLHNIDTLITVNPAKASDSLLKLSDILRYMLYDANSEYVDLGRETEYLRKYIRLQQIRLSNPDLVQLDIHLENESLPIAPMLLIPFVENAFKHTTDKKHDKGISISVKQTGTTIYFETINTFDEQKQITKDQTSGIGLSNVKRRLELIYPNRHQLDIRQQNGRFIVKLILQTHAS